MKLSPQKQKIFDLYKSGDWVCSTAIHFIRDYRKRISEMNRAHLKEKGSEMFEGIKCDGRCNQNHESNIFMYRLKEKPRKMIKEDVWIDGIRTARITYA